MSSMQIDTPPMAHADLPLSDIDQDVEMDGMSNVAPADDAAAGFPSVASFFSSKSKGKGKQTNGIAQANDVREGLPW
jgi:hypothetical protein